MHHLERRRLYNGQKNTVKLVCARWGWRWTEPGPRVGGPGGTLRGAEPSDFSDVSGLETLGAARDVELDAVALGQGFEALGLDRSVVNEHVLAAVLRDETVPLGLVEPLHSSVCHASVPRTFLRGPLDAPRLYAGAPSAAEGKQKRRADWISRGVSFGLSGFTDIRLNQNREKDYTSRASGVNRL